MSKLKEQLKELTEKGGKGFLNLNSKQAKIVTWGAYIVVGVVFLTILSNSFLGQGQVISPEVEGIPKQPLAAAKTETDIGLLEEELESRLERILSQIQGAGKVSVQISLVSGPTYEYATNVMANKKITSEQVDGSSRKIEENVEEGKVVVAKGQSSSEMPVVIKESKPVIQGVIVVAEGASDPRVRIELSRSVETGLGISSYQVYVAPKER